jgi:hypothetical protein
MEGHKLRILQKGQITRGMRKKSNTSTFPPIVISILNKEKGGTPRRMPDLDEPSPIIRYKYVITKLG